MSRVSSKSVIWAKAISYGRKFIHCHGVFDFLHIGHIEYLQYAKSLGGVLMVSVTSDRFVNKGPDRPIFGLDQRMKAVDALECVDFVTSNNAKDACDLLSVLRPDVYCKGNDYVGMDCEEFRVARSVGAEVVFAPESQWSTSRLLERIRG